MCSYVPKLHALFLSKFYSVIFLYIYIEFLLRHLVRSSSLDNSLQLRVLYFFIQDSILDVFGVTDLLLITSGLLMTSNMLIFGRLLKFKCPLKTAVRSKLVGKTCLFTRNILMYIYYISVIQFSILLLQNLWGLVGLQQTNNYLKSDSHLQKKKKNALFASMIVLQK